MGLVMIAQLFKGKKADFFMGMVVLMMGIELLFSWAVRSGYVDSPDPIPFWRILNYLIFPPSIWLFVKYNTDDNFEFKSWHSLLFVPAVAAYLLEIWSRMNSLSLMNYPAWIWFSDYLPLIGTTGVVGYFWMKYFELHPVGSSNFSWKLVLSQLRLLLLMASLTLICLMWLVFNFIGWDNYRFIELTLSLLFLGFTFLNFLENQGLPSLSKEDKNSDFPNFDDEKNLEQIDNALRNHKYYLKPNFPLRELAAELDLPARYVSFLINHYHKKNYKEFINGFRIKEFLSKAESGEKDSKTLLGLALESGFSSKSTFNQVFKNSTGKSPSEYLNS